MLNNVFKVHDNERCNICRLIWKHKFWYQTDWGPEMWRSLTFFPPSEHHTLDETSFFNISSHDVISAIPCDGNCTTSKQWTFKAPENFRVILVFESFSFPAPHGYLEIGDGVIIGETTRLVHFTGTDLPSNVTSVTNAAWVAVHVRCGTINETFRITISAVNDSGQL